MRSKGKESEWLEIKESPLWTLPDENSILPALRLSYIYLTPTIKQCFAFCAMFPKDTEIMKETLIHLWMANGIISTRVNLEVEDVGNMIWNALCQISFFQDIRMDAYSGDIYFKMHDLVHDLAQSVMGSECMILENKDSDLSRSTHHISFHHTNMLSFNEGAFRKVESLRTLYMLEFYGQRFYDCFPTNRSLRAIRTSSFKLSSLGSLIHLRYLELFGFDIETFPDSIYSLRKLEILKLKSFHELSCLPEHLTCLQNLRHLITEDCYSLSRVFPYIGNLSCLRTLSVYIVRLERGHGLEELHHLKLGGKLRIEGLKNVGNLSEAQNANLMGKKDLEELWLSWRNSAETNTPTTRAEQVLVGLQPHSNLKRLKIYDYDGLCLPRWIETLSSLVVLHLYGCKNCVRLSPLRKLPSLKILQLYNKYNVQYIDDDDDDDDSHYGDGAEVRAFPSLEELLIEGLPKLERLLKVERKEMFPRLSRLSIGNCPRLWLPCLPSIKDFFVDGCNIMLLRSISSLYGLITLHLNGGKDISMTSFPEGMFRNLACLQTLRITNFPKLKELPSELYNLSLEHLTLHNCGEFEFESLPEQCTVYKSVRR